MLNAQDPSAHRQPPLQTFSLIGQILLRPARRLHRDEAGNRRPNSSFHRYMWREMAWPVGG
jgi:hypothetical protein